MPDDLFEIKRKKLTKKQIIMRILTFLTMVLIGGAGLFMSGCGVLFSSYTSGLGLLSFIPGLIALFVGFKGIKTVFFLDQEVNDRLNWLVLVIDALLLLYLLSLVLESFFP